MLVLSRGIMETVILRLEDGREIAVTITDVDRAKVRIGFECDRSIAIFRKELLGTPRQQPPAGDGTAPGEG